MVTEGASRVSRVPSALILVSPVVQPMLRETTNEPSGNRTIPLGIVSLVAIVVSAPVPRSTRAMVPSLLPKTPERKLFPVVK
ncbi:hypothetical protein [Mycolicibacterium phocaicum]|uniref:Uncharacterized protein n=1 Tax=Mycolicibacterium phocaicum TaxID=319706 RepID=A0A7I7ZMQ1_9MYCO|nr:hypothetical protein [Mycolicibacterium phocaicum]TLH69904.1 hypothetical protein C1S79_09875 [Mycolicibacterium phocaicum]BBZ54454.1 hypothetical protein MPHO_14460 [Mycolicibacterium phocaicum]